METNENKIRCYNVWCRTDGNVKCLYMLNSTCDMNQEVKEPIF